MEIITTFKTEPWYKVVMGIPIGESINVAYANAGGVRQAISRDLRHRFPELDLEFSTETVKDEEKGVVFIKVTRIK